MGEITNSKLSGKQWKRTRISSNFRIFYEKWQLFDDISRPYL